jgi:hypothetical protein
LAPIAEQTAIGPQMDVQVLGCGRGGLWSMVTARPLSANRSERHWTGKTGSSNSRPY